MENSIYTIGYTGYSLDEFIQELKNKGINVVIDVRSSPYSERYPDYNRDNLESTLASNRIYYRNYVKEFGARQDNRNFYSRDGYFDFEVFAKSEQFLSGVEKIKNSVAKGYRVLFLCAEKEPIQCHRTILVSRAFHKLGYNVIHLKPNNIAINHGEIETQLLNMYFPNRYQRDMFSNDDKTDDDYLIDAYRMQNRKIGYKIEGEE
ncbi:MAG: DUF488 domain-containing protein [Clostridia bacterium]|nr:DUF488 domain-containing protein [Clostridia bacterium]